MINQLIKYFRKVLAEESERQNRLFRLLDGLWENQQWLKDEIENVETTAGNAGADGDDGAGLELVFALYSEPALPTSLRPLNTWGYREPAGVTSTISGSSVTVTWTSTLPEVTETNPHLFASQRDIEGSPDVGDEVTDDWSAPVRLSRFALDGIPGAAGVDGQGIEYVFAAYGSATLPAGLRPDNAWGYDEGGTATSGGNSLTWHDGAPDIDDTTPYLYRASRKAPGKPATGTAVTDTWTQPKIVGRYGPAGAAGSRGVAGADGEDAAGIEYTFAVYNAATLPASLMPDNAWGYDSPGLTGSHTTVVPSTRDITVVSANSSAGYLWSDGTTLWVADRTKLYAYTLADGSRDSAKDITLDSEQGEVTGLWGDGTTLWAADWSDRKLYAYSLSAYNRDSNKDKTNLNSNIRGLWSDGTTFWLGTLRGTELEAYTLTNAARDSSKDITLDTANDNITGIWGDGTTLWVNDYEDKKAYAYAISDGSRQSGKDIPLAAETRNSNGLWSDGTLIWTTHSTNPGPRNIRAYALADGSRTTSRYYSSVRLQWHDGAPNLTETNPYLYRAQRKIEGSPDAGDPVADGWSSPTIVGRYGLDGGRGLRGITGADGSDAAGLEYIFAKYDSATFPSGLRPDNAWGYESPTNVTSGGETVTWEDGAPNIDETNPYLYRCQRKITGSPSAGTSISANWTEPRIVGRYGPDGAAGSPGPAGAAGEDAAGYEYVFAKYSSATFPSSLRPKNTWGYDSPTDVTATVSGSSVTVTWDDGAPSLTASDPYLFRCDRKIEGTPTTGDAVTDNWSAPAVVGRWGDTGVSGKGYEYIYTSHTSNSLPTAKNPSNDWLYNRGGTADGQIWSITAPSLNATNQYLFRAEREVLGGTVDGDVVADHWSSPIVVGRWGTVGAGGKGTEFIYTAYSSSTLPSDRRPSNDWTYEAGGTTTTGQVWTDNIPALSSANRYMFVSKRTIVGSPSAGDSVTDTWSVPSLYTYLAQDGAGGPQGNYDINAYKAVVTGSDAPTAPTDGDKDTAPTGWQFGLPSFTGNDVYCTSATYNPATLTLTTWGVPFQLGAQGARGATGAGGQGIEYLWAITSSATVTAPLDSWGYGEGGVFGGQAWSTSAPATSETYKYLWQVSRKVVGAPAVGDAVAGNWSSAVRISSYGERGPQGNRGATGNAGSRGDDGDDGADGASYEYVYAKYSAGTLPSGLRPSNNWGYGFATSVITTTPSTLTATWSTDAPSLTETDSYLYRAQRKIEGTPSVGDAVTDTWSTPAIIGRYGADGVDGSDGSDGAPGEDGKGKEYVFAVYNSDTLPTNLRPKNNWNYDSPGDVTAGGITITWSDGAQNVTDTNRYLFRAERDIEGSPSTGDTVADTWSAPRIVGAYGNTGPAGSAGRDGAAGPAGRDGRDGRAGTDGTDGIGLEVAWASYTRNTLITALHPLNTWAYKTYSQRINPNEATDTITWSTTPPSISSTRKYLWRVQRTIQGNPSIGDAVSNPWSAPAVESRWAEDGQDGNTGQQGPAGNDGPAGAGGAGREVIFTLTTSATLEANKRPSNTWGYDEGGTRNGQEWHDAAPSLSSTDKYLWACERTVVGSPSQGDAVAANWEDPYITGRWGEDGATGSAGAAGTPGRDGAQGAQGRYHINIYRRVADSAGTPATPTGGDKDTAPANWDFNLPAQRNNQTVWQSFATYDPATFTLTTWSSPYEVGSEGPTGPSGPAGTPGTPGTDGRDGADGKGREVIYAAYNSSNLPAGLRPDNAWGYDEGGTATSGSNSLTWHDANPGLTETNSYLFTAERTIVGSPSTGAAVSDTWSVPKVAGRYGPRGVAGADGQDGAGYEFVFAKYNAVTLPAELNPDNSWGYDSIPDFIEPISLDSVNAGPAGLWGNSTLIWVLDSDDETIYTYNRSDGSLNYVASPYRATISLHYRNTTPRCLWSDGTTMWVTNTSFQAAGQRFTDNKLYAYTLSTGNRDTGKEFELDDANTHPVGLWSDGTTMWVADIIDRKLYAYTLADGSRDSAKDITASGIRILATDVIAGDGTTIWVDDNGAKKLIAYTKSTGARDTSKEFSYDSSINARGLWVDDGNMYILDSAANEVVAYDIETGSTVQLEWHDAAPSLDSTNRWLFRAQRNIAGTPSAGDAVNSNWNTPRVVGYYAVDGTAGARGADGAGVEFVYCKYKHSSLPAKYNPSNAWGYDQPGVVSPTEFSLSLNYGRALTADSSHIYGLSAFVHEIVVYDLTTKAYQPSRNITMSSANSHPQGIWTDGTTIWTCDNVDDKIYAYDIATKTADTSKEFNLHSDNGDPDDIWSDGTTMWVVDATDTKLYAYVLSTGARDSAKDIDLHSGHGSPTAMAGTGTTVYVGDSVDHKFYAYDTGTGVRLTDSDITLERTPDGGAFISGDVIFVSARTATHIHTHNLNTGDRDRVVWHDAAPDATEEEPYTFVSQRAVSGTPAAGTSIGAGWTAPKLLATFGIDGLGVEEIFVAYQSKTLPTYLYPLNVWGYDEPGIAPDTFNLHTTNTHARGLTGYAYSNGDNWIWVVDSDRAKIFSYDLDTLARNTNFDIALHSSNLHPEDIWTDGTRIWVTDSHARMVFCYRISDGARRTGREINLSSFGNFPYSIWSDRTTIWVSAPGGWLRAFNYDNESRVAAQDINLGFTPSRGIWSDGTTMWIMPSSGTHVRAYTKGTNTRVASQEFDIDVAQSLAWGIWGIGNLIYVSDFQDGWIYVYDKTTKKLDGLEWQDNSPALTDNKPYIFRSVRTIRGQPALGSAVAADWETPVVWARQGQDGIAGEAGAGTETIYRLSETTPLPSADYPSNAWGYLSYSNQWSASRMEATEENPYRYSSSRKIIGQPETNSQQDEDWSTPVLDGQWQSDLSIPDISAFWPFEHGLKYDTRKTAAPETSGGGHWQATGWTTGTKLANVTQLCFSIRDEEGIDRHAILSSPTFDHQRWIGIGWTDSSGNHHHAGFRMTGKRTITNGSNGNPAYACFPVSRYESIDGGTPSTINPPADSEYNIYLLLPQVTTSTGKLTARAPGWFQYEVTATVATAMEGLADPHNTEWRGIIADAAEEATLGESLIGDVVTLYRGGITQTRIYSGTAWIAPTQRIDGTLFVSSFVLTRHLAARSVTSQIIEVESVEAEHVKTNSLTGDKFIAKTVMADRLVLGDWFEADEDGGLVFKVNSYEQYRDRELNTEETFGEELIYGAGITHPGALALTKTRMYVLQNNNSHPGSERAIHSFNRQTKAYIASEKIVLEAVVSHPEGLWVDYPWIYTLDTVDNKTYCYNITTKTRQSNREITLHSDNRHFNDLWGDGEYLWVTDSSEKLLYCYDYRTTRSTFGDRVSAKEINLVNANANPSSLWGDGLHLYVLDATDRQVYAYQTLTDEGVKDEPLGMWSDGTYVWVVDKYHNAAFAHHLATGSRYSPKDINLHNNNRNPVDLWGNDTHLYVLDHELEVQGGRIYAYKWSNGNRDTSKEIRVDVYSETHGSITGSGNILWFLQSANLKEFTTNTGSDRSYTGIRQTYFRVYAYNTQTRKRVTEKDIGFTLAGYSRDATQAWTTPQGQYPAVHSRLWLGVNVASASARVEPKDWVDSINEEPQSPTPLYWPNQRPDSYQGRILNKYTRICAHGDYMYIQYFGPEFVRAYDSSNENGASLLAGVATRHIDENEREVIENDDLDKYSGTEIWNRETPNFRSVMKWKINQTEDYDDLPIDGSYMHGTRNVHDYYNFMGGFWVDDNYIYMGYSDGAPFGNIKVFDKTAGHHLADQEIDLFVAKGWGVYDKKASFQLHRNNKNPEGIVSDGTDFWVGDWTTTKQSLYAYFYHEKRYIIEDDWNILCQNPYGIAVKDDVWYVSDVYDGRIYHYTKEGERVTNQSRDLILRDWPGGLKWDIWCNDDTMWVISDGSSTDKLVAYSVKFDSTYGDRQSSKDITLHSSNNVPRGLWSDGEVAWVTNASDGHVYAYRLSNGRRIKSEELDTTSPNGIWGNSDYIYIGHFSHTRVCAFHKDTKLRDHTAEWHQLHASGCERAGGLWGEGSARGQDLTLRIVNREHRLMLTYTIDKRAAPILTVDEDGARIGVLNADVVNTGVLNIDRMPDEVVHASRKLYPEGAGLGARVTLRGVSTNLTVTSSSIRLADSIYNYSIMRILFEGGNTWIWLDYPVNVINVTTAKVKLNSESDSQEYISVTASTNGFSVQIKMTNTDESNDFHVREIHGQGRLV